MSDDSKIKKLQALGIEEKQILRTPSILSLNVEPVKEEFFFYKKNTINQIIKPIFFLFFNCIFYPSSRFKIFKAQNS